MPFLSPSEKYQSTEGLACRKINKLTIFYINDRFKESISAQVECVAEGNEE